MSMLQSFQYRKKETFIHNLDPRTKLGLTILLSIMTMLFTEILPLLLLLLITLFLIITAKNTQEWITSMKGLKMLFLFILVINYFFTTLTFALSMSLRLVVLTSVFSIYFLTVHPDDLAQSLIQLRLPFEFAFAMSMATRYVPTLAMEAQTIMDSQMSRGLELQKGSITQKVRNFIPILVPLIISSVRRALAVAEAIESRAFGATTKRTYLHVLKMNRKDYAILLSTFLICITIIFLRLTNNLPEWIFWRIPF
jgi:energy-coupling factor transport system permease protein